MYPCCRHELRSTSCPPENRSVECSSCAMEASTGSAFIARRSLGMDSSTGQSSSGLIAPNLDQRTRLPNETGTSGVDIAA